MTPIEVTGYGLAVITVLCALAILVEPSSCFPFGLLSSALHSIGSVIGRLLSRVIPSPVLRLCSFLGNYLFYRPNPVFQAFYLLLVLGGYALFLVTARPFLPPSSLHHYLHLPVVVLTVASFVLACYVPPVQVTAATLPSLLQHYPASPLYVQSQTCPTCAVAKPARSKHCSVCGACIARFDHHCVWINQCVGWGNHRYFMLFLAANVGFTAYGAWLLWCMMRWVLWQSPATRHYPATLSFYLQYAMYYHSTPAALLFMAASISVLLFAFTLYHVYLILTNVTTNESSKYSDLASGRNPNLHWLVLTAVRREDALKQRLRTLQREMLELDPALAAQHSSWSRLLTTDPTPSSATPAAYAVEEERTARLKALFKEQDGLIADVRQIRTEVERMQADEEARVARGEGKQVLPNPYHRGWWRNVLEVFSPPPVASASLKPKVT